MKDTNPFRIRTLFHEIFKLLKNPIPGDEKYEKDLKFHRRQLHFLIGESPIFTPQRGKLKGYMKSQGRKKGYHKFQIH